MSDESKAAAIPKADIRLPVKPLGEVTDDTPLREVTDSMTHDLGGVISLGQDGVLRNFDAERNVVDARGISPTQIDQYYEGIPIKGRPTWLIGLDGRNVSEWDLFHPAADDVPKKATAEDRERVRKHNEELLRRGFTCDNPNVAEKKK